MRTLVTGASGLLGSKVIKALSQSGVVTGWSLNTPGDQLYQVDLRNVAALEETLEQARVDVCVHTAAIPDVAACESDPESAWALNARGTEALATACASRGIRLVYTSTDYVFDGKEEAYDEEGQPHPLQVYGQTKLAGERYVLTAASQNIVIRLPLLYGYNTYKKKMTFPQTVIETLKRDERLAVDDIELRQPTLADDAAAVICTLVVDQVQGIVHVAPQHGETKFTWAKRIATTLGSDANLITRVNKKPAGPARPKRAWMLIRRLRELKVSPPRGADEALLPFIRMGGYHAN